MAKISLKSKAGEITITRTNRCKSEKEGHCEFVYTPETKKAEEKFEKAYDKPLSEGSSYFSVTDDGKCVKISFMVCTK